MLLACAIIWGSAFVVMKEALDGWPPALLLAVRFLLGTAVLCLIFWKKLRLVTRATLCRGSLCGLVLAAAYLSQTYGLNLTTPGKNAFLTTVYCVLVPFVSWGIARRRPNIWNLAGAVLCLAGIGLISLSDSWSIEAGDSLTLLCGVLFAFQISLVDWCIVRSDDPVALTLVQSGVTGVVCLAVSLMTETMPARLPQGSIWQLAYLVLCSTALAELLQILGQARTLPSLAAVLMCTESVFGALCSVIFYGEQLTPRVLLGFATVFVAVLISQHQPKTPQPTQS